jgi:hypothetical protein
MTRLEWLIEPAGIASATLSQRAPSAGPRALALI